MFFRDVFFTVFLNFKVKKLGPDLLVQSSRLVQTEQLVALFYTSMVPGALGLKECAKGLSFMNLICFVIALHETVNETGWISVWGAEDDTK